MCLKRLLMSYKGKKNPSLFSTSTISLLHVQMLVFAFIEEVLSYVQKLKLNECIVSVNCFSLLS